MTNIKLKCGVNQKDPRRRKRYFCQNPAGLFLNVSMADFSQISISKFTNSNSIDYSK